ncbi:hypothetical protein [Yoonia sp.]|uniref:hypothetical protein n=1 Tax=Yoonia sp. TaxID=2212373 RepID=UPI0019DA81E2|nr:hypothetical protein [Yoonia sp.]MBE0413211.1 hypothetical protein [Yoonia sp.]
MTSWNPEVFDRHIDPIFTEFSSAEIPEPAFGTDGHYWMTDYFLNSTFGDRFEGRSHQLIMGFIWRSQLCFQNYSSARESTLGYLDAHDPTKPKFTLYFRALGAWEIFLLNGMIAIDYLNKIKGQNSFAAGDGTKEQRIWESGNDIKHMQSSLKTGSTNHYAILPIILTNVGVKTSSGNLVSYLEMFELLQDFENIVDEVKDPRGMLEKRLAEEKEQ